MQSIKRTSAILSCQGNAQRRACVHVSHFGYDLFAFLWVTLWTIFDLGRSCATNLHAFVGKYRLVTADQIWSRAAHTGPRRVIYLHNKKGVTVLPAWQARVWCVVVVMWQKRDVGQTVMGWTGRQRTQKAYANADLTKLSPWDVFSFTLSFTEKVQLADMWSLDKNAVFSRQRHAQGADHIPKLQLSSDRQEKVVRQLSWPSHGDLSLPVWKILKCIAKCRWTGMAPGRSRG